MVVAQADVVQLNHFLLPAPLIILPVPPAILPARLEILPPRLAIPPVPLAILPSGLVILSVAKNLTPLRTGSAKNLKTLPLRSTQGQGDGKTSEESEPLSSPQ